MFYYLSWNVLVLRPDLPAVRLTSPFGTTYFPIEVLRVAPRQRVPISKQTAWQMKDAIKVGQSERKLCEDVLSRLII